MSTIIFNSLQDTGLRAEPEQWTEAHCGLMLLLHASPNFQDWDTYLCLRDLELQFLHKDGQKDDESIPLGLHFTVPGKSVTHCQAPSLPVTNLKQWSFHGPWDDF